MKTYKNTSEALRNCSIGEEFTIDGKDGIFECTETKEETFDDEGYKRTVEIIKVEEEE